MPQNSPPLSKLPYRLNRAIRDFTQRHGRQEITWMMAQGAIIAWLIAAIVTAR